MLKKEDASYEPSPKEMKCDWNDTCSYSSANEQEYGIKSQQNKRKQVTCSICNKMMRKSSFKRHLSIHKQKMDQQIENDTKERDRLAVIVCEVSARISSQSARRDRLLLDLVDADIQNSVFCYECGENLGVGSSRQLCNKTFCSKVNL